MYDGGVQSPAKQPDDIAEQRETTHRAAGRNDAFTKGPEHQPCYLEALHAPGDTHQGATQYKTAEHITDCGGQATEYQPDNVADEIHPMKIQKKVPPEGRDRIETLNCLNTCCYYQRLLLPPLLEKGRLLPPPPLPPVLSSLGLATVTVIARPSTCAPSNSLIAF